MMTTAIALDDRDTALGCVAVNENPIYAMHRGALALLEGMTAGEREAFARNLEAAGRRGVARAVRRGWLQADRQGVSA